MAGSADDTAAPPVAWPRLVTRGGLGGLLMGLANLVPGISGGTMLLAAGIYPDFIGAVADVTRLRFSARTVATLVIVGGAAVLSILLGAGLIKDLVLGNRWVMYSLFIGLTLGGAPMVWRLIDRFDGRAVAGAVGGFVGMTALAIAQARGAGSAGGGEASSVVLLAGGVAAASAMILPGVSGSYLLLVMGLYVPILTGIDALKVALKAADISAIIAPLASVVAPVGVGVVLGIALVSNLLKLLIDRQPGLTYGALLGLLLGAVVGLWPFQQGVAPVAGDVIKGVTLTAEAAAEVKQKDWPMKPFQPSPGQVGGSFALVLLGVGLTTGVGYVGRDK